MVRCRHLEQRAAAAAAAGDVFLGYGLGRQGGHCPENISTLGLLPGSHRGILWFQLHRAGCRRCGEAPVGHHIFCGPCLKSNRGLIVFDDVFICIRCNRASVGSCRNASHLRCSTVAGDRGATPYDPTSRVHLLVVLGAVEQVALSFAHTSARLALDHFSGGVLPQATREQLALEHVGALAELAGADTPFGSVLAAYAAGTYFQPPGFADGEPAPQPTLVARLWQADHRNTDLCVSTNAGHADGLGGAGAFDPALRALRPILLVLAPVGPAAAAGQCQASHLGTTALPLRC
jgi:hypothetical protein